MVLVDDKFNGISFAIFDNFLCMITIDNCIIFTINQEYPSVHLFEYFLQVNIKRIDTHVLLKIIFERLDYHFYHKLRNK